MWLFDMGRSKFGRWLKNRGISQQWVVRESGVSKNTINDLVLGKVTKPTARVGRKIIAALRKIDPHVSERDFWST